MKRSLFALAALFAGAAGATENATINQTDNTSTTAEIYQTGDGNNATINQTDNTYSSTYNQIYSYNDGTNYEYEYQSGWSAPDGSITQNGTGNTANVEQSQNSGSKVSVNQNGNWNSADVHQDGTSGDTGYYVIYWNFPDWGSSGYDQWAYDNQSFAQVNQTGDGNYAHIGQLDTFAAKALVVQSGGWNVASIDQSYGSNLTAGINQNGYGNYATIVQQ